MRLKLYFCRHCKTVVNVRTGDGSSLTCCGEPMERMVSHNSYDEGWEKHLPVVERVGDELYVKVGEMEHPMRDDHHIDWIYVQTLRGGIRQICLDSPTAVLHPIGIPVAVYAYCNLHGLWKINL